jgi:putative endonuclease
MVEGFTKRYGVHQLVWNELHETIESAIEREKQMKEWKRKWKLELIEAANQNWRDLYYALV